MSRSRTRWKAIGVPVLSLVVLLSGCGSGTNSQSVAKADNGSTIEGVDNQPFVLDYLGYLNLAEAVQASVGVVVVKVRGVTAIESTRPLPIPSGDIPADKYSALLNQQAPVISIHSVIVKDVLRGDFTPGDEIQIPETGTTTSPLMKAGANYLLILLKSPKGVTEYLEAGGPNQGRYLIDEDGVIRNISHSAFGAELAGRKLDEVRDLLK